MDSRLKNSVMLLTLLLGISIVAIVVLANLDKIRNPKKDTPSLYSESKVEPATSANDAGFTRIGGDLYAWKNDPGFFDNEDDTLAKRIMEKIYDLSIECVSVEGDARVFVKDFEQNLKTGIIFEVVFKKGAKEFSVKDYDMDGVIYTDNLEAGDYEVSLLPVKDYTVPEEPRVLTVKEAVEYFAISGIEILFKEESAVSPEEDDLMAVTAVETASKNALNSIDFDPSCVYGIDLPTNVNYEEIDWNAVYASGIRFVMLRAGYRGAASGSLVVDSNFKDAAKKAYIAGLDVGAYFFSQAVNEIEAVEEASALLEITKDVNVTYPLCVRFDQAGGFSRADELDADTRTLVAEAFCQTIKNMGYTPCVYSSSNRLLTALKAKRIEKYCVWMAEFDNPPEYDGVYDIWQYSYKGKVKGIEEAVYLNASYIK